MNATHARTRTRTKRLIGCRRLGPRTFGGWEGGGDWVNPCDGCCGICRQES